MFHLIKGIELLIRAQHRVLVWLNRSTLWHQQNMASMAQIGGTIPTIYKAYMFRPIFKGISPENMAKHMVLT